MQQNVTDDKSLIDQVYELLASEKQSKTFYDLANAIVSSDIEGDERNEILARLYTTMNMDGRFLSVGQNFWGLKNWYPVEQHDEEVASKITPKRKRKNVDDDYDEDFDDLLDDDFDEIDDLDEDDNVDDSDYDEDDEDDDEDEDDDLEDFDEDDEDDLVDDFDEDSDDDDDIDSDLDLETDIEDEE